MQTNQKLIRFICTWCAAVLVATGAVSQSWTGHEKRSPLGLHTATLIVQMHEFSFQISCDESAAESGMLNLMFFGPALPRLYGTDGQEETLLLSFNASDGTSVIREWDAYYFDGGLGDQAWLGGVKADNKMLVAFSEASEVALLNKERELVYRFPAQGTAAGTRLLQATCGVGQQW